MAFASNSRHALTARLLIRSSEIMAVDHQPAQQRGMVDQA
jgi:hypothetical protein